VTRWRCLMAACLCLVCLSTVPVPASAEEITMAAVWEGEWQGSQLSVVVIARGHDIPESVRSTEPWWRWGNTSSDAYLFFWSNDQLVDLVVDFTTVSGRPVARIFAPTTRDARIALWSEDRHYTIPEDVLPVLTFWPREGDWLREGVPNFNLEGHELDLGVGMTDWFFRVGEESPGVPGWVTRTIVASDHDEINRPHFTAAKRMDPEIPFTLAEPLMPSWPFLSAIGKQGHWGDVQPIFFDRDGRTLATNWTGFHIAGMYQINSISYPPGVNFEAPFAFYRFDPDAQLYANMVIRADVWPARDPVGPPPIYAQRSALRMTWTGVEPNLWRYSLTVAGDHALTEDVTIGTTTFRAVPYDELPGWITSKEWKAVTFVEAVSGETGSEGIYDYSVEDNYPVSAWLNGLTLNPPTQPQNPSASDAAGDGTDTPRESGNFYTPYLVYPTVHPLRLATGFRGEYSLAYERVPGLYLSSVDNRVHLLYADQGVWNLGGGRVLRVRNLNGDAYIDRWSRERVPLDDSTLDDNVVLAMPGRVEEDLYMLGPVLLRAGGGEVELLKLDEPIVQQTLTVPTERQSWQSFVAEAQVGVTDGRDPLDFSSWLSAFSGDRQTLTGASIADVRTTEDGFRFVLKLGTHWSTSGVSVVNAETLETGSYLVTYDGTFHVVPLTLAQPSLGIVTEAASQFEATNLTVHLTNSGLQDMTNATLEVYAQLDGQAPILVNKAPVTVLAETSTQVEVGWTPPAPGTWRITAEVRLPDGRRAQADAADVPVAPARAVTAQSLVVDVGTPAGTVLTGVILVSCALLAAALCWRFLRAPLTRQADNGD
jgi:hypothetical protein